MKTQLVSFVVQGLYFSEAVRIFEQDNKALINSGGQSVQEHIALSLSLRAIRSCTNLPLS